MAISYAFALATITQQMNQVQERCFQTPDL